LILQEFSERYPVNGSRNLALAVPDKVPVSSPEHTTCGGLILDVGGRDSSRLPDSAATCAFGVVAKWMRFGCDTYADPPEAPRVARNLSGPRLSFGRNGKTTEHLSTLPVDGIDENVQALACRS
jgi:hypothetical protein